MMLAVLVLLAAVLVILLVLLFRRPGDDDASALLQQQLIELRRQLGEMATAQQAVPQALAEGRAEQSRSLAAELAGLSALVTRQLTAAQSNVGQRLDDTGRAVADVRERLGQLAEVTKRLEVVGQSVAQVQQLLQVPKLRGTLGEVWLEELLRQIFPASHYTMQHAFRSGERVDAVVRVGERLVPIDAKFPLEACQRMLAAEGDAAERERRVFRRSLRDRVDEIADKYIRPEEGTLDFALMYVPAENVYYEAVVRGEELEQSTSFMAYAMGRRVIPVSPHTFYAYLCAILHGLKGLEVEQRAREIQGEIAGLEQQFQRFWTAFEKVGTHLGHAQKQYEESRRLADRVQQQFSGIASGQLAVGGAQATLPAPEPAARGVVA